jgi:hypothetical protein
MRTWMARLPLASQTCSASVWLLIRCHPRYSNEKIKKLHKYLERFPFWQYHKATRKKKVSKVNSAPRLEECRGAIEVLPIDEQHSVEVITIDDRENFIPEVWGANKLTRHQDKVSVIVSYVSYQKAKVPLLSDPQGGPRRCCHVRARDHSHMIQKLGATFTGQNIRDHGMS